MVVEGHPAVRELGAGLRLADIVQQRCQPDHQVGLQAVTLLQFDRLLQHGQRVLVHVLVPHVLIGFQPQPGHLGQDHIRHPGVHHQLDPADRVPGVRREQQLLQLIADPLRGHDRQPRGQLPHGRGHFRGHGEAELRGEPGRAHHPQRVVGEGLLGAPWRAQQLVPQVTQAAERVHEFQGRQPGRHRVHAEVPPPQVGLQGGAVLDPGRLARVGHVRLTAVGGDLEDRVAFTQPDRAELDPDLPDLVRPVPHDGQDLRRRRVGGQVQVAVRPAEEHVPDRAADQGQLMPVAVEDAAQPGGRLGRLAQQGCGGIALTRADGRGIRHGH